MNRLPRIVGFEARDVRFPTSRWLDGSDAMHTDPDYSAAYVVLRTDADDGVEGHGLTFNEWAAAGVNVNAVAPGYVATDNTQALQDDPVRSAQILQRIPAGRWGEASDIAGAVLFLASSAADYVHGVVLPVDGGWLAR